ncbi:MAG TPA: ABC transporter substrate-binding protein, partial [Lachnospiraceae bacterium]|nr:ABC transporter substrate-binding protein [Lachnospiraceae bacterium]
YDYITIEDDSQSSDQDWKAKIAADFAVGNEPDVIQYFTDANASDVLAANKLVSIEEIKKSYPNYAGDTLDSALIAAANPDGVERAVPTTGYWEGLFCNKDLFDQYGLELPTDWDKMETAIKTFKENGIIPIA